jgi:uncharacterized membrane protein (DUF2068 family)
VVLHFDRSKASTAGVRTIAAFEAAKGLLVLAAGLGLLTLLHKDVQEVAESIVRHLHLNPARHMPQIFLHAAARMTDKRLLLFAVGAFAYSLFRLVEAYGLWFLRPWAEWLAIVSAGLYLPVEVVELVRRPTFVRGGILITNVIIVVALLDVRLREHRARRTAEVPPRAAGA